MADPTELTIIIDAEWGVALDETVIADVIQALRMVLQTYGTINVGIRAARMEGHE